MLKKGGELSLAVVSFCLYLAVGNAGHWDNADEALICFPYHDGKSCAQR